MQNPPMFFSSPPQQREIAYFHPEAVLAKICFPLSRKGEDQETLKFP